MIDHDRFSNQQKSLIFLIASLGKGVLCMALELAEPFAHFPENQRGLRSSGEKEMWGGGNRRSRNKEGKAQ